MRSKLTNAQRRARKRVRDKRRWYLKRDQLIAHKRMMRKLAAVQKPPKLPKPPKPPLTPAEIAAQKARKAAYDFNRRNSPEREEFLAKRRARRKPEKPRPKPPHKPAKMTLAEMLEFASKSLCFCGADLSQSRDYHHGHKHPRSRGGSDEIKNLHPQCAACNLEQGTKTLREWIEHRDKIGRPLPNVPGAVED
jgi:5-methylcytosine-specific restriction endonuclease McrA